MTTPAQLVPLRPRVLTLTLKGEYFDAIKAGDKREEYRLRTPYWHTRLVGRDYDVLVLRRGYARADDDTRKLILPWRGFALRTIKHPHFGPDPVRVFAIRLATH